MGLDDDVFLHVYERVASVDTPHEVRPVAYHFNIRTGDTTPWRLSPRITPFPVESDCAINRISHADSCVPVEDWTAFARGERSVTIPANTRHQIDFEASSHSTAFLRWVVSRPTQGSAKLTFTYANVTSSSRGHILGCGSRAIVRILMASCLDHPTSSTYLRRHLKRRLRTSLSGSVYSVT